MHQVSVGGLERCCMMLKTWMMQLISTRPSMCNCSLSHPIIFRTPSAALEASQCMVLLTLTASFLPGAPCGTFPSPVASADNGFAGLVPNDWPCYPDGRPMKKSCEAIRMCRAQSEPASSGEAHFRPDHLFQGCRMAVQEGLLCHSCRMSHG